MTFDPIDIAVLLALLLAAWGIVSTLQTTATRGEKTFWISLLVLLPLVGFVIWFFFGPGAKSLPGTAHRL